MRNARKFQDPDKIKNFDADFEIFNRDMHKYKGIKPKPENFSFYIYDVNKKYIGSAKRLQDAHEFLLEHSVNENQ